MADKRIKIEEPFAFEQRGLTFFSFVLTADELLEYGRIERFQETEQGVQRAGHDKHIEDIVAAMRRPEMLFTESIVVFLTGDWSYRQGTLVGKSGSYLSIENGQHRWEALRRLTPEERAQFAFAVTAMPMNLSFEHRLRTFLQQGDNKPIDARLQLAQRYAIGEWASPQHKVAYEICLALNSDEDSPLQGQLIMLDSSERPYESNGQMSEGINVKGVFNALVRVLGPSSKLALLNQAEQLKVVKNFLRIIMEEVWPHAWGSKKHVLSTARGINALLLLFTSSPEFKAAIGNDLREENLRNILMLLRPYTWTKSKHTNLHERVVVDRLNGLLARSSHGGRTSIQVD